MATLFGMFPFLKTLFADSGYQGPKFAKALAKVLPHLDIEIVKRSDQVSGFAVLPKRWIVERTIAWLNRCRRLAKDWSASTERRSRSCASPQSASCSENSAIRPEVSGRTLRSCHHGRRFQIKPPFRFFTSRSIRSTGICSSAMIRTIVSRSSRSSSLVPRMAYPVSSRIYRIILARSIM